jgi:hypothetical protein
MDRAKLPNRLRLGLAKAALRVTIGSDPGRAP